MTIVIIYLMYGVPNLYDLLSFFYVKAPIYFKRNFEQNQAKTKFILRNELSGGVRFGS